MDQSLRELKDKEDLLNETVCEQELLIERNEKQEREESQKHQELQDSYRSLSIAFTQSQT